MILYIDMQRQFTLSINDPINDKVRETLLDAVAEKLIKELKLKLREDDHIFSGNAEESLQYYKDIKTVGSELDYIRNIEYGRQAGSHVPIKPLKEWAMTKMGLTESEAWGVAKAIEKKIFEEGIDMTRFAKKTLNEFSV